MSYSSHFKYAKLRDLTPGELILFSVDKQACYALVLFAHGRAQTFGLLDYQPQPFSFVDAEGWSGTCLTAQKKWKLTPKKLAGDGDAFLGTSGHVSLDEDKCRLNFERHQTNNSEGADVLFFNINGANLVDSPSPKTMVFTEWELWLPEDKTAGLSRESLLTFPL